MAKRPSDSAKAADIDEVNQDTADDSQEAEEGEMSKMDMVVAALDDGHQTAKTGIPYLDKRYPGHGITASYYSICKSNHLKKQNGESTTRAPRTNTSTQSPSTQTVRDLPNTFGQDMVKLKELIESAGGAEELKDMFNTVGDLQQRYGLRNINQMIDALS